jgi:hypothetical protein
MILLITYDLNKPGQDYTGFYEALKSSGWWWHHLNSTWIIKTDQNPTYWYNKLSAHIYRDDNVLIIEVKKNYWGYLPQKSWTWLEEAFNAEGK